MPFILEYTDPGGTLHAESYWIAGAISYNAILQTGQVIFQGYHDRDSYEAGGGQISGSPRAFATTDPVIFVQYFAKSQIVFSGLSFQEWVEAFAQNDSGDLFFEFGIPFAPVDVFAADIGFVNKSTLTVTFYDEVTSGSSDYSLGVELLVNGSPVTPVFAEKQDGLNAIWYTIAPVGPADDVSFEYDAAVGDLVDIAGQFIQSVGPFAATNTVGSYLRFSLAEDSGLLLML